MSAIGIHHTDTSTGGWDGPANEARLRLDESEGYYKRAYAWQDAEGDPTTKSAYKFIHHQVDSDGAIGAANVRAGQTGIGVLNGGRGGADIPDGDRRGVYNHLAAHLRDADVEPPDLRTLSANQLERRSGMHEVRASAEGEQPRITWYPAVYDQLSDEIYGFRERIRPGAFTKTLQEADVRALLNHNENYVLGRSKSGTLALSDTPHGLLAEVAPPDTTWARDLITSIRRGDIDHGSFQFRAIREKWETVGDGLTRDLLELALFDVSIVTFPAYPQTAGMDVRSLMREAGIDWDGLIRAIAQSRRGLGDADADCVRNAIRALDALIGGPRQEAHSPITDAAGGPRQEAHLLRLRRRLEIAERAI